MGREGGAEDRKAKSNIREAMIGASGGDERGEYHVNAHRNEANENSYLDLGV